MTWRWFKVLSDFDAYLTRATFKCALLECYGDNQLGNPFSQLKLLRQTTIIDGYVEAFEILTVQVPLLTEEQYMGLFLGGLRKDIRLKVLAFEPLNRHRLIFVARLIKCKLGRVTTHSGTSSWRQPTQ